MTRENKLAMVIGFGLLLFVGILVSDHLSARSNRPQGLVATALPAKPSLPGGRVEPATLPVEFGGELPEPPPLPPSDGENMIARDVFVPAPLPREETAPPTAPVPTPDAAGGERRYTIAQGDNPGKIAKQFYGQARLGESLARHNKVDPRDLRIGQELVIPPLAVLDPNAAAMPSEEAIRLARAGSPRDTNPSAQRFRTVTVGKGDTLYGIAERVYGDGTQWPKLASLNGIDAKDLRPGMQLRYALAE